MLKHLIICDDPFNPESWERIDVNSIADALMSRYDVFPEHARLYKDNVAVENDITPRNDEEIAGLSELEGTFYFVNYPAYGVIALIVILIIVAIVAIAFRPKIPSAIANRNVDNSSPNNALSGRTNNIRINGRIPDIFGTVRSTPDLIAVPYSVYENDIEVEYCFMCVGRGTYAIAAENVRDGQTPVLQIPGTTVEVFGPETSPNLPASGPQLRIGDPITRPVISVLRSKSVNGQILYAPNDLTLNNVFSVAADTFNFGVDPDGLHDYIFCDSSLNLASHLTTSDYVSITDSACEMYQANYNADYELPVFNDDGLAVAYSVRFYANGRIEFQSLTGIGSSSRPLNSHGGYGYLILSDATLTDGTHTAILNGKYVVSGYDDNKLIAEKADSSSAGWADIAAFSGGVTPYKTCFFQFPNPLYINVSGRYAIQSVVPNKVTLVYPDDVRSNNDWAWFPHVNTYHQIENRHAYIGKSNSLVGVDPWVGPFVLNVLTTTEIIANFVADQGMYKDNGTTQTATSVTLQLGVTACTATGTALGAEQYFAITLTGSAVKRSQKADTLFADLPPGRYMVRARRLTPKDLSFTGQISDEVKWRDLYSSSPVGPIAFGDVTTLHTVTHATAQALAVSERQINALVTRMIPLRSAGSTFTTDLHATNKAEEIISFICLDPKLGNRKASEINFDNIYLTLADVRSYFGIDVAGEFSYTIDNDNLSFEEILAMVSDAVFCSAHRRNGDLIELTFEKKQDTSALLFNHRNKVPGSETRTVTFGNTDGYDGIEYEYVSPVDDAILTYYVPEDQSAIKPRKETSVGIRSSQQARLHAYRLYNKLRYQTTAVEFDATQEADLLSLTNRILVADNTRPDTQDGEIVFQSGLLLQLSQPAVLKPGNSYLISLQLSSGSVENIPVTAGIDPYHVVLSTPPSVATISDGNAVTRTQYQIVRIEDVDKQAFLLTSKEYKTTFICTLQAINYDPRYYSNDRDYIDGFVYTGFPTGGLE